MKTTRMPAPSERAHPPFLPPSGHLAYLTFGPRASEWAPTTDAASPMPKRSDPRLPGFRNIFLFNSTLHKGTKEIFKTQENSISEPQHETKGLAAADTDVVYDVLERVGKRGRRERGGRHLFLPSNMRIVRPERERERSRKNIPPNGALIRYLYDEAAMPAMPV